MKGCHMDGEDIDYLEVAFETNEELEVAKKALPFSAITPRPSGLLIPDQWDKENVEEILKPLNIKFKVLEEGFKWDDHGDDDQWNHPSM